jgi:hypothetical protein
MDIFGAFQLCAIGILAAPVTVRLSKTYLYELGRNVIFLWAGLILAGISLPYSKIIEPFANVSDWARFDKPHG